MISSGVAALRHDVLGAVAAVRLPFEGEVNTKLAKAAVLPESGRERESADAELGELCQLRKGGRENMEKRGDIFDALLVFRFIRMFSFLADSKTSFQESK